MPKWWMAEIVRERQCFRKVFVYANFARHRAGDLRDFNAMGQTRPEVIAVRRNKDLSLMLKATKGRGMDDPIPVPLEATAPLA
tara:strand:+ start:3531 stop:3779 length:249 start_codon:yes stop_codon:yes gene_type:complete